MLTLVDDCITLVDLLVGTEPCLRTNKAIDKKICSCGGLVERRYDVNGHPRCGSSGQMMEGCSSSGQMMEECGFSGQMTCFL